MRDDAALRADQFDRRVPVAHVVEDRDVIDMLKAERAHLFDHRLAVIDDMVCAQLLDPAFGLRARGRGNDDQPGRLGQLDADRADAATGADDQHRLTLVGTIAIDAESIKERLVGGDRGQRQRRGFGKAQALRLEADDALVHQLELRVGAGAGDVTGVVHLVADLEQGDVRADGLDHAAGIPTQHARRCLRPCLSGCGPWCRPG